MSDVQFLSTACFKIILDINLKPHIFLCEYILFRMNVLYKNYKMMTRLFSVCAIAFL
jgi:hypothetical protein